MLREFDVTMNKPATTMYKNSEDEVITGMGVVKDEATKTFGFAVGEVAANVYLVDKERIPNGMNALRVNMSDYADDFVKVGKDEFAKLIAYYAGERFGTDQVDDIDTLVMDDKLAVTNGIWAKTTNPSKYIFKGIHNDNGHKLAIVEVSDVAV